jgi:hypothetical protein
MFIYAFKTNKNMTDNEASPAIGYNPENQERLPAEYLFVFCEHTPEYADKIGAAVADCDTVAFEYVGFKTAEERKGWEVELTRYVSSSVSDEEKIATGMRIEDELQDDYLGAVVTELTNSDKAIALIDMDQDSPGIETQVAYENINAAYIDAIENNATSTELKELVSKYITASLASFSVREAFMTDQLKKLGVKPGKIGVVTGALHESMQATIAKVAETSRIIIGPETVKADGTENMKYSLFDQTVQDLRSSPEAIVSEETLNRIVLVHLLDYYEIDLGDHTSSDLVLGTSEANVTALLAKFDTIREKHALKDGETHSITNGWLGFAVERNDVMDLLEATWPSLPQNHKSRVLTH